MNHRTSKKRQRKKCLSTKHSFVQTIPTFNTRNNTSLTVMCGSDEILYHNFPNVNGSGFILIQVLPIRIVQQFLSSSLPKTLLGSYVKENKAKNNTAFGLSSVGSFKEKIIPMESLVKMLNTDRVNSSEMSLPAEKNSSWFPTLSRTQRLLGFAFCFISGLICLGLASLYIPLLLLKARKFGTLYTFGSVFFLLSFAILLGPGTFGSHMFSKARLPLTLVYFSSLFATLFCSIWWRSTLLTLICVIVQVFAFIWFMLAYIPGGERGMRYLTSTVTRLMRSRIIPFSSSFSSSSTLPV
ncbi:Protein transport protein SFT2 [Trichinella pseudospiralis]|uniref:Vesicle transport protein n=1 Tax=Trichinella pseudospiralis TaxID=6337 RepID=A0A0V1JF96_TRIPS|nr:Protein transport protein SFT2 [Trichinella pseudospiralis]